MIFNQHDRFEEPRRQRPHPDNGDEAWSSYVPPSTVVAEARGGPKIVGEWVDPEYRKNRSALRQEGDTPLYPHEDFTKPNSKVGGRMGKALRPCAEDHGSILGSGADVARGRKKQQWRRGRDDSTPGPGAYRVQHRMLKPENTPQILPRRDHGGIFEGNKKGGPGPGQYNVLGKMIKKSYNKKACGGFKPSLPKKSKPSLTDMAPFRMRSQEERRKINTPFSGSPRGQQTTMTSSPRRPPTTPPPTSKAFNRNSRTSSSYRGRRVRSPSPVISSFGIGPTTAIKRGWSAEASHRDTRMAASRSLPNSPRSPVMRQRPDSGGGGAGGGKNNTAPKSPGSPRTPTVLQWTSRSGKRVQHRISPPDSSHGHASHHHYHHYSHSQAVPSPEFSSPRGGHGGAVHIGGGAGAGGGSPTTFLTQPDSSLAHTHGYSRSSNSKGIDAVHLLASPRTVHRQWPQYEFSDDDDDDDGDHGQIFPGLQQDSEDSRHFYVPPLSHAGLSVRQGASTTPTTTTTNTTAAAAAAAAGGGGGGDNINNSNRQLPVHKRTTAAVDQAQKGPAQFMHEIRGALDDLKALSKLKINAEARIAGKNGILSPEKTKRRGQRGTGAGHHDDDDDDDDDDGGNGNDVDDVYNGSGWGETEERQRSMGKKKRGAGSPAGANKGANDLDLLLY